MVGSRNSSWRPSHLEQTTGPGTKMAPPNNLALFEKQVIWDEVDVIQLKPARKSTATTRTCFSRTNSIPADRAARDRTRNLVQQLAESRGHGAVRKNDHIGGCDGKRSRWFAEICMATGRMVAFYGLMVVVYVSYSSK
ncbi:hypothetical protein pipiens_020033 [Culex pipiens pipiens]|uniref:Uncharacterized protein n=1 Tax=Culex pipiens pipiens TaxID=38569 RepID=A0ABD1DQJ2_CULPP